MAEPRRDPADWVDYAGGPPEKPAGKSCVTRSGRLFFAAFLIAAGILLFLGNLGVLPIDKVWQFWPIVLIAAGVGRLMNYRQPGARIWSVVFLCFGTLFLLMNLGVIRLRTHDKSWPISLLLILGGCSVLAKLSAGDTRPLKLRRGLAQPPTSDDDVVSDFVFMGSLKRNVESLAFEGGGATSILGNIELDLRHASISTDSRRAVIDVTAIFGATKIRIPSHWRVRINGTGILGNFEDKTIPPNTGSQAPTLIVTGISLFGAVEIED